MVEAGQHEIRAPQYDVSETAASTAGSFHSILFPDSDPDLPRDAYEAPDFFHDLNLVPVVEAITHGREEYDLAPLFHLPLHDLAAVAYRHEVMRDMEHRALRQAVESFAHRMQTVRQRLKTANKSRYELESHRWKLAAVEAYAEAIERLSNDLHGLSLVSQGLRTFRDWLRGHARSNTFTSLVEEARTLVTSLDTIRYSLLIRDGSVTVRHYEGESDYSASVEETFRKFQTGSVNDYLYKFKTVPNLNHIEAQVLDRVALLNPGTFASLAQFCERHANFLDPTIGRFDREIQFYAAYLDYLERFRSAGLAFCYPEVSDQQKDVMASATFDVALADKLVRDRAEVVCNDFHLQGAERIFVVTGPNQGGKTTFARTFGQLHHLASLGCQVPGREARLFLFDRLFTHFEREEDITNLRGKLEDDLIRIHRILSQATPNSVVVMNEIFSSTTLEDALFLGREVLARIVRLDLLCVLVTFLDELAAPNAKVVSMVSAVDPHDPSVRTFKVERRPADGLAYALAIAEKHRVTRRWLQERIRR